MIPSILKKGESNLGDLEECLGFETEKERDYLLGTLEEMLGDDEIDLEKFKYRLHKTNEKESEE